MKHVSPPTVAQICEALGRENIARRIGVGLTAVSNAATENRFPARWFLIVKELCDEAGLPCPPHLFNFAGIAGDAA